MLFSSLVRLVSVSVLSSSVAFGIPLETRESSITCTNSFNTNWHLIQHNTNSQNDRPAGFVSARDSNGYLELTTSVGGVPTSSNLLFTFYTCQSSVMPSQTHSIGNGVTRYYGTLRPSGHQQNCVTFLRNNSNPKQYKPLVSLDCPVVDNSGLIYSWWSLDVGPSGPANLRLVGYTKGSGASNLPPVVFNNFAVGNANVVEASYSSTSTGYTLQLTKA
ncbi:hypothetical protein OC846_001922 [Tilletia horrida]|uniref:Uncharacterized protein n=1 Tax=Tilletia horrida TaxID=155126 RepID=A0AAN6GXY7_9BASI|nr:hypothetical protein OC845_002017 [Tilletia horrida]KAK0554819.1 hypothetical protein OC846_001922 [Tilletia horrida]KAK0568165.1 hypothetical protein OC861_002184 [Tilletia horrida]